MIKSKVMVLPSSAGLSLAGWEPVEASEGKHVNNDDFFFPFDATYWLYLRRYKSKSFRRILGSSCSFWTLHAKQQIIQKCTTISIKSFPYTPCSSYLKSDRWLPGSREPGWPESSSFSVSSPSVLYQATSRTGDFQLCHSSLSLSLTHIYT